MDVPIVSVQSDLPEEKKWVMDARKNESDYAYACCYYMRDMLLQHEKILEKQPSYRITGIQNDKLSYLFHYCMNYRSKYVRELKTKVRRKEITDQ